MKTKKENTDCKKGYASVSVSFSLPPSNAAQEKNR
jgi:hypothetical protein